MDFLRAFATAQRLVTRYGPDGAVLHAAALADQASAAADTETMRHWLDVLRAIEGRESDTVPF